MLQFVFRALDVGHVLQRADILHDLSGMVAHRLGDLPRIAQVAALGHHAEAQIPAAIGRGVLRDGAVIARAVVRMDDLEDLVVLADLRHVVLDAGFVGLGQLLADLEHPAVGGIPDPMADLADPRGHLQDPGLVDGSRLGRGFRRGGRAHDLRRRLRARRNGLRGIFGKKLAPHRRLAPVASDDLFRANPHGGRDRSRPAIGSEECLRGC
jgi:hypothetical protein